MSRENVRFENESFMARIVGGSDIPVKCTPVVYDEMSNCGVGVYFENGTKQIWGMVTPRNLVVAWRGTEILRRLNVIKYGTLAAAYYTGLRDPHESDLERYVTSTIAKIGQETHKEIMSMPIPEEIIQAILDNQGEEFKPDLWPITDEVRAGTIQWRQEFADAGIKHPDEIDAENQARNDDCQA